MRSNPKREREREKQNSHSWVRKLYAEPKKNHVIFYV
jgi:hypothetical protein